MRKTMLESIKATLKEWDSSDIIDAAFNAAEVYGEEPDWFEIIDRMVEKIPRKKFKEFLKKEGISEEEFYDFVSESDPDSVISSLEGLLSKKDIKDIVDTFAVDEEDYDEDYEEEE